MTSHPLLGGLLTGLALGLLFWGLPALNHWRHSRQTVKRLHAIQRADEARRAWSESVGDEAV